MSKSKTEKKTPYQGRNRCRGFFTCDKGHFWKSEWSWANCGMKCIKCLNGGETDYTYPHSQEPLEEIWHYCEVCDEEFETKVRKPLKCQACGNKMYPIIYLTCPFCKYEHGWPDDPETANELEFKCSDYAEEGYGCKNLIGLGMNKEGERTGPHPQELCEKCAQLKCPCSRRRGRRRRKGSRGKKDAVKKKEDTLPDVVQVEEVSKSQKKNKRRRRRRKEKTTAEDSLCTNMDGLNIK